MDDKSEAIRQRAYAIWKQEGRPPGRDYVHWHRAKEEITLAGDSRDAAFQMETEGATQALEAPLHKLEKEAGGPDGRKG